MSGGVQDDAMATSERTVDRGRRRGRYLRIELGRELRDCRMAAGLSQAAVARAIGVDQTTVGKIERAACVGVSVQRLSELFAAVGHELGARAYPCGPPLRDAAHVALLQRAKRRIGDAWRWRVEVAVGPPGDLRAWDAVLEGPAASLALEAETSLRDVQALLRRIDAKLRDSGLPHVILVVADTRGNRGVVRAADAVLRTVFTVPPTATWAALRLGRDPGGNALLFG
jgi:transcriptional regulator with XRE-family HTH domain